MQLKTGRKAWKNSKTRFSQTVRKLFATIANFAMSWQPVSHCEIQYAQYTVPLRNLPLTKPMRNFALPKFAMSSQTNFAMRKFCNAKFAMRISQCQFRNAKFNFAMPISNSQCQYTIHMSHNQILSEISHCEIRKPLCEIRKPSSHCQLHQLCEIYICRPCHPL